MNPYIIHDDVEIDVPIVLQGMDGTYYLCPACLVEMACQEHNLVRVQPLRIEVVMA